MSHTFLAGGLHSEVLRANACSASSDFGGATSDLTSDLQMAACEYKSEGVVDICEPLSETEFEASTPARAELAKQHERSEWSRGGSEPPRSSQRRAAPVDYDKIMSRLAVLEAAEARAAHVAEDISSTEWEADLAGRRAASLAVTGPVGSCSACGSVAVKPSRCGRCRRAVYCGRACQVCFKTLMDNRFCICYAPSF